MSGRTSIAWWALAAALLTHSMGWAWTEAVQEPFDYFDDFSTDQAETDSYAHSVFWPEGAVPPKTPHLYYHTGYGDGDHSLVFMDYEGEPAHLSYHFSMETLGVYARTHATIEFDARPLAYGPAAQLSYALSTDGWNWSNPMTVPLGYRMLALDSLSGDVYVRFFGSQLRLDSISVHLHCQPADLFVPSQHPTIQDAIEAAGPGMIIEVAPGTYTGPGNWDIDFQDKEITLRSALGPEATIIDCRAAVPDTEKHRGFYFPPAGNVVAVLRGFTIVGGALYEAAIPTDEEPWPPDATRPVGGGILCEYSSPTIVDCVIRQCTAQLGGGIACVGGAPTIIDCVIENCSGTNVAPASGVGTRGGGIALTRNCEAKILRSVIRSNQGDPETRGGGVYVRSSTLLMRACKIYDNGGGYEGSIMSGGAISCAVRSNVTLQNCLIFANHAQVGGGIFSDTTEAFTPGLIDIKNCTVAHNDNAGIHALSGNINISNSIVWHNQPPQLQLIDPTAQNMIVHSNVEGGPVGSGAGNISQDPCFVRADDAAAFATADFHLRSREGRYEPNSGTWVRDTVHSPCIDAGDPGTEFWEESFPHGHQINMGAYGGTAQAGRSTRCRVFHVSKALGFDGPRRGSKDAPMGTIQEAIETADDCDMVLVWPGVYDEPINFTGKSITVAGAADAPVLQAPNWVAVSFHTAEGSEAHLSNLVITNSLKGIACHSAWPTIEHVTIVHNGLGIEAYGGAEPTIRNSIFWDNIDADLYNCQAFYSCIEQDTGGFGGNISLNPLFVDAAAGDYHLRSETGRFWVTDPNSPLLNGDGIWVTDNLTSPCVDRGDPTVNPRREKSPNGGRINMGAYGGTAYASISAGWPLAGDVNRSGAVDAADAMILADGWLREGDRGDATDDQFVNLLDLAVVARDWLEVLPWAK